MMRSPIPESSATEHERRRLEFAESTVKNNLRGIGSGIALFSFVALGEVFFYLFSPTWLSLRTDAGTSQCWRNDGILQSGVHSGHGPECEHAKTIESTSFCDVDPKSELCQATQIAALFSICNIVVLTSCIMLYLLSGRPRLQDAVTVYLLMTILSGVLGVATIYVMMTSSLFSAEYLEQLRVGDDGKDHFGVPFIGFASCSFDTPFARLSTLLRSSVFRCVFPGSAALVAVIQVLTSIVASIFAVIFVINKRRLEKVSKELALTIAAGSPHLLPNDVIKLEQFSILGEFDRRYNTQSQVKRMVLIGLLPCGLTTLQGCTLLAYLLNGISIVSTIRVSLHHNGGGEHHPRHPPKELFSDELNVFNFSPLTATSFFWQSGDKLIAIASFTSIALLPLFKLVVWIYFVFVPSKPVLRSRALFICDMSGKFQLASLYILTFMSIAMSFVQHYSIPIEKSKVVPTGDAVDFNSQNQGGVGRGLPHIHIDVRTAMNPGIGSWMFEVTFISSLAIGQLLVSANLWACEWHEKAKKNATGLTTQLEQIEEEVGGDDVLYQAETSNFKPYDWTEDESQDDSLYLVQPLVQSSLLYNTNSVPATPLLPTGISSAGITSATSSTLRRSSLGDQSSMTLFSPRRSNLSRRSSMTTIHPYVLSLSDRTLYPQKGVKLKFTAKGKLLVISFLLFDGVLLLVSQFVVVFSVRVSHLFALVKGEAETHHSLSAVFLQLLGANGQTRLFDVASLFMMTTCIAPIFRLFGMIVLWLVPLTLVGKRRLLHGLEILSAWSSLDVFILCLVMLFFGMESSTRQLIADAIPGLSKLIQLILPEDLRDLSASIHPGVGGFSLLVFTVIFDKFVAHIVFEQAVASIAERIADETLNEAVMAVAASSTNTSPQLEALGFDVLLDSRGRALTAPSESEIIDTAEGILETNAVTYFGPVERYISALMPSKMYAGFPRRFWNQFARRAGIVDDADVVAAFNDGGLSALQTPMIA